MENINILVAEDFEFNQLFIKHLLDELGSKYVIAGNGEEAVRYLESQHFDIVFMDIEMPVMDGVEATRILKSSTDKRIRETPVIGFTGHKDAEYIDKLKQIGFVDFIKKPFSKDKIVDIVKKYVNKNAEEEKADEESNLVEEDKIYDFTTLRDFCDGDEQFVLKMVSYFIENSPLVILKMKNYLENSSWDDLRMEAHKFNSELGLLGITKMMSISEKIEEDAEKHSGMDLLKDWIDKLEEIDRLVIERIKSDFKI